MSHEIEMSLPHTHADGLMHMMGAIDLLLLVDHHHVLPSPLSGRLVRNHDGHRCGSFSSRSQMATVILSPGNLTARERDSPLYLKRSWLGPISENEIKEDMD